MFPPGWRGCQRRGRGEGQDRCRRDRSYSHGHQSCWCCRGWSHYHSWGSLYWTLKAELSTPYCLCLYVELVQWNRPSTFSQTVLHLQKVIEVIFCCELQKTFSRTIVYIFISLLSRNCMQTVTCDSDMELHLTSQSLLLYWLWSLTWVQNNKTVLKGGPEAPYMANWPQGITD